MIGLIWAQARGGVIGADGDIPWRLPEDQARFRALTTGATVVMGRRTWESLPERFRPLPRRRNVVLTRRPGWSAPGAEVALTLEAALGAGGAIWVIGGAEVYRAALPWAGVVERTEVDLAVAGDVHAPVLGPEWIETDVEPPSGWSLSEGGLRYRFASLRRSNPNQNM